MFKLETSDTNLASAALPYYVNRAAVSWLHRNLDVLALSEQCAG
jgi:hypothetical protein